MCLTASRFGISTIVDIFSRISRNRGWLPDDDASPEEVAQKDKEKQVWNEVMKQLREPFEILSEIVDQGLQHSGMALEIVPPPKGDKTTNGNGSSDTDVEKKGDVVEPGDPGFAAHLKTRVAAFQSCRHRVLQAWAREVGLVGESGDGPEVEPADVADYFSEGLDEQKRDRIQLFILLFMGKLASPPPLTLESI